MDGNATFRPQCPSRQISGLHVPNGSAYGAHIRTQLRCLAYAVDVIKPVLFVFAWFVLGCVSLLAQNPGW